MHGKIKKSQEKMNFYIVEANFCKNFHLVVYLHIIQF